MNLLQIISSLLGVGGFVMGLVAYRRTVHFKRLDLRLQLRKDLNAIRSEADQLPGLCDSARKSFMAVASAVGEARSGAIEQKIVAWEVDRKTVDELLRTIPPATDTFVALTEAELETKVIEYHSVGLEVARIKDKCRSSLTRDDGRRAQISAAHDAMVNSTRR